MTPILLRMFPCYPCPFPGSTQLLHDFSMALPLHLLSPFHQCCVVVRVLFKGVYQLNLGLVRLWVGFLCAFTYANTSSRMSELANATSASLGRDPYHRDIGALKRFKSVCD